MNLVPDRELGVVEPVVEAVPTAVHHFLWNSGAAPLLRDMHPKCRHTWWRKQVNIAAVQSGQKALPLRLRLGLRR